MGTSSATSAAVFAAPSSPMRTNGRDATGAAYPKPTRGSSVTAIAPRADEAPTESPLDAEIPLRDRVLERRGRLEDLIVLHVEPQRATDAAVRANGVGLGLSRLVPCAVGTHIA